MLWLGYSTFRITSTTGKIIVIDPFLKTNPRTPAKYKDLTVLGKVDLPELAKLTGATDVANYELANTMVALGTLDATKTLGINIGGMVSPIGPGIKVHMVPAEHTSSPDMKEMKPEWIGTPFVTVGTAIGYVMELESGFKIYHSGDTNVFGDMDAGALTAGLLPRR